MGAVIFQIKIKYFLILKNFIQTQKISPYLRRELLKEISVVQDFPAVKIQDPYEFCYWRVMEIIVYWFHFIFTHYDCIRIFSL